MPTQAPGAEVAPCRSAVGGGSLPGETLPSVGVAIDPGPAGADALAARLRAGDPAVVARIADGRVLLDLRTVFAEDDELLLREMLASM